MPEDTTERTLPVEDGGPAYPVPCHPSQGDPVDGMSLLDAYAIAVFPMVYNECVAAEIRHKQNIKPETRVEMTFGYAELLVKESLKRRGLLIEPPEPDHAEDLAEDLAADQAAGQLPEDDPDADLSQEPPYTDDNAPQEGAEA